MVVGGIGESSW